MISLAFDTLSFSERLQKAGATKELADAHAKLIHETVITALATKEDLQREVSLVRSEIKSNADKLTIRIGGMIALAVAVIEALGRFA